MTDKCESCSTVNENLYWTHFTTMHFCQFLTRDYRSRLMIPKKFADNKRMELHDKMEIRGPSGAKWEVDLATSDENLYFGDGWEEFVNDHTLEQNDILIFNYKGNSQFDVLILDKKSLCEKEESYFVRKCGHDKRKLEDGCHAKLLHRERSMSEIIEGETDKELETTPKKKPRKDQVLDDHDDDNNGNVVQETVLASGINKRRLGNLGTVEKKNNISSSAVTCAANGRRSITEAEKKAVLRKACEDLSEKTFIVIMRATHVHKKFFMTVPAEWLTRHVIQSSQDMILRTKERSWKTRLVFYTNGHGGLSKGWKEFALGNSLEEDDVCLFKLATQKNETLTTLDVAIFRVVPEAIPLSPNSSSRITNRLS